MKTPQVQKRMLLGIKNKITLAFILFLIIPIILILITSASNMGRLGRNVSEISGQSLESEEYRSIEEITTSKSAYIDEFFKKKGNDIEIMAKFTEDIFNEKLSVSALSSYYHTQTYPALDYEFSNIYGRLVSFDASMYITPQGDVLSSESKRNRDLSAHLDVMFKQLEDNDPDYTWRYIGFELDGLWRCYPFSEWQDLNYDPRLRPWYIQCVEENQTVYTDPYMDNAGLGLMITVASPIHYTNGTLIGVIAGDILIGSLQNAILNTKILESGYAFLVDDDGDTITHPGLSDINLNTPITDEALEGQGIQSLVTEIRFNSEGTGFYQKDGEQWYYNYRTIPSTGYKFAVIVPEEEIIGPALSIQDRIQSLIGNQILILIIVLGISVVIIGVTSNYVSKRIVHPITNLTKMMNFISKGSISREIPIEARSAQDEIAMLTNSFQNLVTMLRLGNSDYYRGNLDLAAKNYQKALEIFEIAENKKGIGICANNLGNIYRIRGDFHAAEEAYKLSIKMALNLKMQHVLPKRYNNLAQLYADSHQYPLAVDYFNRGINVSNSLDDDESLALIYRNYGLLIVTMENYDKGIEMINDALEIDTRTGNDLGMAYDQYYLGKTILTQKQDGAINYLEEGLKNAQNLHDKRLQVNILKQIELYHENEQNRALIHQTRVKWKNLEISLIQKKLVIFVIDVSGSMNGSRMRAARDGALEIYETQIYPQDEVAVIVFDSRTEILLPPTQKGGNENFIKQVITGIKATPYQTAFYDAIGDSYKFINDRISDEHKWVIALTDGMDNSSESFNLDNRKYHGFWKFMNKDHRTGLREFITENLLSINMITIGIGNELFPIEDKLKLLCESNMQGRYIPVHDTHEVRRSIQKAFLQVSELMAQINVEEFIED